MTFGLELTPILQILTFNEFILLLKNKSINNGENLKKKKKSLSIR
jgi:hypothetical protein